MLWEVEAEENSQVTNYYLVEAKSEEDAKNEVINKGDGIVELFKSFEEGSKVKRVISVKKHKL
jgi:hypothetical protein